VVRLRGSEREGRRLLVDVLCGFELEAQLRQKDMDRLRRRFLHELRQLRHIRAGVEAAGKARADHWRTYARRLEDYCVDVLWSPQVRHPGYPRRPSQPTH
jgi:hypothetical protein